MGSCLRAKWSRESSRRIAAAPAVTWAFYQTAVVKVETQGKALNLPVSLCIYKLNTTSVGGGVGGGFCSLETEPEQTQGCSHMFTSCPSCAVSATMSPTMPASTCAKLLLAVSFSGLTGPDSDSVLRLQRLPLLFSYVTLAGRCAGRPTLTSEGLYVTWKRETNKNS